MSWAAPTLDAQAVVLVYSGEARNVEDFTCDGSTS